MKTDPAWKLFKESRRTEYREHQARLSGDLAAVQCFRNRAAFIDAQLEETPAGGYRGAHCHLRRAAALAAASGRCDFAVEHLHRLAIRCGRRHLSTADLVQVRRLAAMVAAWPDEMAQAAAQSIMLALPGAVSPRLVAA